MIHGETASELPCVFSRRTMRMTTLPPALRPRCDCRDIAQAPPPCCAVLCCAVFPAGDCDGRQPTVISGALPETGRPASARGKPVQRAGDVCKISSVRKRRQLTVAGEDAASWATCCTFLQDPWRATDHDDCWTTVQATRRGPHQHLPVVTDGHEKCCRRRQ